MSEVIPVNAEPAKQFFVRMLTRDIELLDAVLDLIDNCIDGIIRNQKKNADPTKSYAGFYAKITANKSKFIIEDNCGGISKEVAEKVAFRLGRPSKDELTSIGLKLEKMGTVGVYGIGMKRAIFKMGEHAVVRTEHGQKAYEVEITPEWMNSGSWKLEMVETDTSGTSGTRIEVTQLRPEIVREFSPDSNFLIDLHTAIAQLFAIIIEKGFRIELNGATIQPVGVSLLVTPIEASDSTVNPYVFKGRLNEVDVEIVVGFYRPPYKGPDSIDADDLRDDVRQAGWSVICNDRLVLYGDKTAMTGWGSKPVPRFHNQYNSIAGVVTLKSDDPELLPLTTTKHKIDISFGVYFTILDFMKDGVRRFIDFTNEWKGRLSETALQFKDTKPMPVADIPKKVLGGKHTKVSAKRLAVDNGEAKEFTPELSGPTKDSSSRQIRFTRSASEISEIGRELLSDPAAEPKDVGEACFNKVLREIRNARKKP